MVVSVPCDIGKDQDTSFEMNKFSKKEPINFCKFCDNEGATYLLLPSDHFVSSKRQVEWTRSCYRVSCAVVRMCKLIHLIFLIVIVSLCQRSQHLNQS